MKRSLAYWLPTNFGRWFGRLIIVYVALGLCVGAGIVLWRTVMEQSNHATWVSLLAGLVGIICVFITIREHPLQH